MRAENVVTAMGVDVNTFAVGTTNIVSKNSQPNRHGKTLPRLTISRQATTTKHRRLRAQSLNFDSQICQRQQRRILHIHIRENLFGFGPTINN